MKSSIKKENTFKATTWLFVVPFVQKVDSALLWINHYSLDDLLGFGCILIQRIVIYQLDSAVQPLNSSFMSGVASD